MYVRSYTHMTMEGHYLAVPKAISYLKWRKIDCPSVAYSSHLCTYYNYTTSSFMGESIEHSI